MTNLFLTISVPIQKRTVQCCRCYCVRCSNGATNLHSPDRTNQSILSICASFGCFRCRDNDWKNSRAFVRRLIQRLLHPLHLDRCSSKCHQSCAIRLLHANPDAPMFDTPISMDDCRHSPKLPTDSLRTQSTNGIICRMKIAATLANSLRV